MTSPINYALEYTKYLQRWCKLFGDLTAGKYGIANSNKHVDWYDVQRLTKPQFIIVIIEYEQLRSKYWIAVNENMHAADTISGQIYPLEVKLLKYEGSAGNG
jgi:hypothetical protein